MEVEISAALSKNPQILALAEPIRTRLVSLISAMLLAKPRILSSPTRSLTKLMPSANLSAPGPTPQVHWLVPHHWHWTQQWRRQKRDAFSNSFSLFRIPYSS